MKNLILILFTMFLTYKIQAQDENMQWERNLASERMIYESEIVIAESRQLRNTIKDDNNSEDSERSLASIDSEQAKWGQYWDEIMDESTEDPLYWLNKAN